MQLYGAYVVTQPIFYSDPPPQGRSQLFVKGGGAELKILDLLADFAQRSRMNELSPHLKLNNSIFILILDLLQMYSYEFVDPPL